MSESFDAYYTWLGIPPAQQPPNHYRLLGVELFESNADVIERAADRCMADLRTHQTGKHSAESQKLLNEVAAAKVSLLDPKKKAGYDATLREKQAAQESEAVGADVFTALGGTALRASSPSAKNAAKAKSNAALIGGATAAAVVVALITAWAFWPGEKKSDESPGVAMKETGQEQALAGAGENPSPKEAPEKSSSAAANLTLPESPSRKADNPDPPKASEAAGTARQTTPPASEPTKTADPPAAPSAPALPPPGPASPAPAEEAKKRPIPSAEIQRDLGATIEETYKISEAKAPEAKVKLAKELSEAAKKSAKPEEQYVLLRKAVDLACDGGDAVRMLKILGPMTDAFKIDPLVAKAAMLERFTKGPRNPARVQSLVEASAGVIDEAVADDRYEIASTLAKTVADACSRGSPQFRKETADRRKRVQQAQKQFEQFQKALEALKTNPEAPEANLAAGTWYCFAKDDWPTGLPHLAKGSDALLKSLANRELSTPPATPEDQLKLADAWWDGAAERRGEEKAAMLRCAGQWYEQAIANLEGINKTKAEKRLAEIAQQSTSRPGREPSPAIAPFDAKQARRYQLQWARHLKVPVEFVHSIGMKFVLISPGEFDMGSPEQEVERLLKQAKQRGLPDWYVVGVLPNEKPQHRVKITHAFYLGICEVTQTQYSQVMGSNPSQFKDTGPDAPVEQVSWDEAVAFCRRLSGMRADKTAPGEYRLPTEAEWEYAARAGTTTAYFFGDDATILPDYTWYDNNSGGRPHVVGQKRPNPFGLYDVLGNVWEWCADAFSADYYKQAPAADPLGPPAGAIQIVRGASWHPEAIDFRCACRNHAPRERRFIDGGFRVARTLAP